MSVIQRHKNWWNEVLWKPKKAHSLEQLKFNYQVLQRNTVVTDHNRQLLVETFRSIAEILIWGDQNDSRVFDFFLEKNMQSFFLRTLTQRCGRFVCVQLLQTLNILFENIKNETAIYYLLSNNHVNSIIVLKLDFSDEEVLAYYISFVKTLSFRLNSHTIHFFYNEHLRDFPLYTEAIKFFNHSETMVRIAVRTLTLNVFKVDDKNMLEYIRNKTAAPYFSNLIWFIGNHIIELDECLISQAHHLNRGRLEESVAEHLDHLHYIGDIQSLGVEPLNAVLVDHLLNRLLIPLYVYSLSDQAWPDEEESPRISSKIALFLLSQVFLTLSNPAVVTQLAYFILTGDSTLSLPPSLSATPSTDNKRDSASFSGVCAFVPPTASLDVSLNSETVPGASGYIPARPVTVRNRISGRNKEEIEEGSSTESMSHMRQAQGHASSSVEGYTDTVVDQQYVLIEASPHADSVLAAQQPAAPEGQSPSQKSPARKSPKRSAKTPPTSPSHHGNIPVVSTVFLDALMSALAVRSDDSKCLFALALIYSLVKNKGVHPRLLEAFSLTPLSSQGSKATGYNNEVITLILSILDTSTVTSNCIRLVTLKMATMLLKLLLGGDSMTSPGAHVTGLSDHHIALIESIYESSILQLRLFYKGTADEIFLDMFEDEYHNEKSFHVKVPYLMMDAAMLLPPTDTPLTGIDFTRRLPCGENERARKAMRVFFAIRMLSQQMSGTEERELPLTLPSNSGQVGDVVDLNNCDLVACVVTIGEKASNHFMVVTETEFLLVDPDKTRLGWGIIHFIAFLQDVDITADPATSCSLFVTIHSRASKQKKPALSGRFQFEDHIRCIAAKQVIQRSRDKLRGAKMTRIAKMLHIPLPDSHPSSLSIPGATGHHYNHQSSVISLTPTPDDPRPISPSTAHQMFAPAGANHTSAPDDQDNIEMSNLRYSTLFQSSHEHILDSSIRLALPYAEDQTVHLDTARMGVRYHRDWSSSPSPSCEVDTLESSGPEDSLLTLQDSEECAAVGYSVTKLKESPVERRKKEQQEDGGRIVECGALTIIVSSEQDKPSENNNEDTSAINQTVEEPPLVTQTAEEAPIITLTAEEAPIITLTAEEVPIVIEEAPVVTQTVEDVPIITEEAPVVTQTVENAPLITLTAEEAPIVTQTLEDVPIITEEAPVVTQAVEEAPVVTLTAEEASVVTQTVDSIILDLESL
ncbi:protein CLEC16A-like isoform X2 [Halichondria panicea]|uniref:protein CLEC16A-like isoform X2 n=1 Tax=Halichondria panicea TaxID=6063 RepID=UPI00312B5EA1